MSGGRNVNLGDALAFWSGWNCEVPPIDGTGNLKADFHLAEAFQEICRKPNKASRLKCIELLIDEAHRLPMTRAAWSLYCTTLIYWWIDLFEHRTCVTVLGAPEVGSADCPAAVVGQRPAGLPPSSSPAGPTRIETGGAA